VSKALGLKKLRRKRGARFAVSRIARKLSVPPTVPARGLAQTLLALISEVSRAWFWMLDAVPENRAVKLCSAIDRIDAIDPSAEMIRVGRSQVGG